MNKTKITKTIQKIFRNQTKVYDKYLNRGPIKANFYFNQILKNKHSTEQNLGCDERYNRQQNGTVN